MSKTPGAILAEMLATADPAERDKKRAELQRETKKVLQEGCGPGAVVAVEVHNGSQP
jgi:hypothetical protein